MPDMIFPIIVLVIVAFLILSFLIHLIDIVDTNKMCDKIIDNQSNILNWKYTISTKDDENE
jgi:hypothetical protein